MEKNVEEQRHKKIIENSIEAKEEVKGKIKIKIKVGVEEYITKAGGGENGKDEGELS